VPKLAAGPKAGSPPDESRVFIDPG
jgi:hypothetical protein